MEELLISDTADNRVESCSGGEQNESYNLFRTDRLYQTKGTINRRTDEWFGQQCGRSCDSVP